MAEISAPPVPADASTISAPPTTEATPTPATSTPQPPAQPEHISETLYIQNLNEKIKIDVLKASLRGLFKTYGEVLDVVAHKNLRMRGQAFVSFADPEIAKKAMTEVRASTDLKGLQQISFAKTRSDAVVKKLDQEHFDEHKARRQEHKSWLLRVCAPGTLADSSPIEKTRYTNPLKQKFKAKRLASEIDGGAVAPAPKRPNVQMPDEYLPPNKILFLQNLPESVTKDQLVALFSQYPNLHEVRLIPTKKDIAFVEYLDEASSTVAKDALHNYKLDGENKIKITFARK
ncbi:hypothetical protein VNI00_009446 [Paramarasmius palmivorus]|uniref:RRM domain-containing protein n=1 Tax=Paramarasmius palmivorus TaxID=297713 RepID=A0AAW0CS85_9AGAR